MTGERRDDQHWLLDYWRTIVSRRLTIGLVAVATTVTVLIGVSVVTPVYEATATLYVKQDNGGLLGGDLFGSGISALSTKEEINTLIAIFESRAVLEQVVADLELAERFGIDVETLSERERAEAAVRKLRRSLGVRHMVNTRLISVSVQSEDPVLAQKILDTTSRIFIDRTVEAKRGEANAVLAFVSDQVDKVSDALTRAEQDLLEYKQEEGIGVLSEEARLRVNLLADLESEFQGIRVEREVLRTRTAAVMRQMVPAGSESVPLDQLLSSPAIVRMRDRLASAQTELTRLETLEPSDPARIAEAESRVELLEGEIRGEVSRALGVVGSVAVDSGLRMRLAEYQSQDVVLSAKEKALSSFIDLNETEIARLPSREISLLRLERARRINDELYGVLMRAKNEAQIEAASQIGNIEVIDPARTPVTPVWPRKIESVAVGGVLGLFAGIGLAFLMERMDSSLKSEEEVRDLSEAPILGFVPCYEAAARGAPPHAASNGKNRIPLALKDSPTSFVSEAFRLLRANLNFVDVDNHVQCIEVTSPVPADGKTTVAANLAMVFASQGEKVAVVDADFRVPAIHKIFNLPNSVGVTDLLTRDLNFPSAIQHIEDFETLDILTCGPLPPVSSELLASAKMKALVDRLRGEYDRVIFDMAPVLAGTDAVGLASWLDGVLLVVRVGETDKRAIRRVFSIFDVAKVTVLGNVVNCVNNRDHGYGYGGYAYYSSQG